MRAKTWMLMGIVAMAVGMTGGCSGRTTMFRNSDPALRKSPAQHAADAVKLFPYKADAPRGGEAVARAHVGYSLDRVEIVNLSEQDWNDVEVWVNEGYAILIPTMKRHELKILDFRMLYNDKGTYFPTDNRKVLVNKVEIYRDGKMFDVTTKQAD
jgi:hypothetical protein